MNETSRMDKFVRYGKSFRDIASLKLDFFEHNEIHLQRCLELNQLYAKQPRRTNCKVCAHELPAGSDIEKHGVNYVFCTVCGQLNGKFEDTEAFCEAIYTNNGGIQYAKEYSERDLEHYEARCKAIYVPKAKFLDEVIRQYGENIKEMSLTDIGAGSGYFIRALKSIGMKDLRGFEVGAEQVRIGNTMNGENTITKIDIKETGDVVQDAKTDMISFIGVFEHLQDLRGTLRCLRDNRYTKYIYMCVPMVSPTVFNEVGFPSVMPRHLSVGHTHLFTEESINYICREYGLDIIAEWWFGTDIMDYYRSISVELKRDGNERSLMRWQEMYSNVIDELQLVLDKNKLSSQVHMVLRRTSQE